MITITHTPEDGTLATGDTRPHAATIKAHGWRWARTLSAWYVPQSRDMLPKLHKITPLVTALEAAGETVTLDLSDEQTSVADRVARQLERAETRQERLEARAERAEARATQAWERGRAIGEHIPMGQPVLVGHHSERRHRRDLARIDKSMQQMCEQSDIAEDASYRADASARHQARKMSGPVTMRRIEKLNADLRLVERRLPQASPNYRQQLEAQRATLTEEITYWNAHLEDLKAQGWHQWSAADFSKGDKVKIRGRVAEVVRVNKKSISVTTGYSWTDTITYDEPIQKL